MSTIPQVKIENERPVFPFTAIIGQEQMKLALILNVIDPRIGGVMIMGDRGTGKSTTIRAVADLLPAIKVAAGDPFNSSVSDFELMRENIKNAVGAGDAFCAGFIFGIHEEWDMETTLKKSHAAGSAMMKIDSSSGNLPNIKNL